MNSKKKMFLTIFTCLSAFIVCVFGFEFDLANIVYGDVNTYEIAMNSSKNKLTNETAYTSGNASVNTNLGNEIEFTYSNISSSDGSWQTVDKSGYFYNTTIINGLRNIQINTANDALFRVYYSRSCDDFSKYVELNVTANVTNAFDFNSTYPDYFKVVNYSGASVSINSINLVYTCSPSDAPINPVPTVTTEKFKTTITPNFEITTAENKMCWLHGYQIADFASEIYQIEYVIEIGYKDLDNGQQWYGGGFGVGSNNVVRIDGTFKNGMDYFTGVDANNNGCFDRATLRLWFDVYDITTAESIYLQLQYAGSDLLTFTVREINLYRDEGYAITSQEVNVDGGGLYWIDGNTGLPVLNNVVVPLDLDSNNLITYFDLNITYNSSNSWTSGVLNISNNIVLPSGNGTIDFHGHMTAGDIKTATVRVYLHNYTQFSLGDNISFAVYEAQAWSVNLNSITFYQLSGESSSTTPDVEEDVVITDEFLTTTQTPLEETLGMDNINSAMSRSLVNKGNNYLLKSAINKMQSGEETTIAFIGGSMTEGDFLNDSNGNFIGLTNSWAYRSYEFLASKYGTGSNVKYHNAAMSGTRSDLGVARFKTDVINFNPDIVFIEYAVNNGETDMDKETYESMIRMALNHEKKPAVILVMSWTNYSGGNVEAYMTDLGLYYDLPVISIHQGLNDYASSIYYNAADLNKSFILGGADYNIHPTINGHKLYAKLVCHGLVSIVNNSTMDEEITSLPTAKYGNRYENMDLYQRGNSDVTVTGFDLNEKTYVSPTPKNSYQQSGQGGWKLFSGNTGTLSLTKDAKVVFVLYCANVYDKSAGTINVTVSGEHSASASRNITLDNNGKEGWGQICVLPVLLSVTTKNCNINLSLNATGGTCQIIGIAVA